MAVSLSTIAAKDSAGSAIAGGLQAQDKSGAGTGPFTLGQVLIDGKAGANMLGVFAEDAASADGDTGIQVLTRRTDTAAASAGTDGDYQPFITDASGRLHVNVGNTVAMTLAAGAAAIAKAEDVASADADVGVPAMAIRKATPANTSSTDGDYEMLQMSAGRLWTDSNIRFGGVAPDLGPGTGGAATLRVAIDSSQVDGAEYETVPANTSSPQTLGAAGAVGDFLAGILVVPATTSPGPVTLFDGTSSPDVAIPLFTGGASSVSNLVPFFIPLGMNSLMGGWKVTTGTNVSIIGVGNFT